MFTNRSPEPASPERWLTSPFLIWAVVLITLLAFFLRTHQLYMTPPGFNYDEAAHALDAAEILQGRHIVWSDRSGGNPTLLKYLIAGFFAMLGERPFSQRLLIAFMSTATVPALYLLARTAFLARTASMIDAARSLGLSPLQTWWRVNLPLARPAVAGPSAEDFAMLRPTPGPVRPSPAERPART